MKKIKEMTEWRMKDLVDRLELLSILEDEDFSSPKFEMDFEYFKKNLGGIRGATVAYLNNLKGVDNKKDMSIWDCIIDFDHDTWNGIDDVRKLLSYYRGLKNFKINLYEKKEYLSNYLSFIKHQNFIDEKSSNALLSLYRSNIKFESTSYLREAFTINGLIERMEGLPFVIEVEECNYYSIDYIYDLLDKYEEGILTDGGFREEIEERLYLDDMEGLSEAELKKFMKNEIASDRYSFKLVEVKLKEEFNNLSEKTKECKENIVDQLGCLLSCYIEGFVSISDKIDIDEDTGKFTFAILADSEYAESIQMEDMDRYSLDEASMIDYVIKIIKQLYQDIL